MVSVGKNNGITARIDSRKGEITLHGEREKVLSAQVKIMEILTERDKNMLQYEKAEAVSAYVQWSYQDGDKWRKFNPFVNAQIEEAYQNKTMQCTVKDRTGVEYVVDLKKNEEHEKKNPSKKYTIRRQDVGSRGIKIFIYSWFIGYLY